MPWRRGNKLKFVRGKDAQGRTAEIYEDIKSTLGVPLVNVMYQAWAAYPAFLDLHWRAVKPALESQQFYRLGDRLRADAYTRTHNYFSIPDLCHQVEDLRFSTGAREELAEAVELFHYSDALLMLIVCAQLQAFDTHSTRPWEAAAPALRPVFERRPVLIEEEMAPGPVKKIYEDIKRTNGCPFINTEYRALARWPDFLSAYWQLLKPMMQAPMYAECRYAMRETAWSLAREVRFASDVSVSQLSDAGMEDEDVAALVRITEMFVKNFSGLLLNIAAAKIGMEGGTAKIEQPQEYTPSRAA